MNNRMCSNNPQCYIIRAGDKMLIIQQQQVRFYRVSNSLQPNGLSPPTNILPPYSPIQCSNKTYNNPVQPCNQIAESKEEVEMESNAPIKRTRRVISKRKKIEISKDLSVQEITAYQKLSQQMVMCYLCNRSVKKIKTFEYICNCYICLDCVVDRSISKNYLKDWSYDGSIECHGCKNKRFLSSFICYKESSKLYYKSPFCVYCRNIHEVYEMRRRSK